MLIPIQVTRKPTIETDDDLTKFYIQQTTELVEKLQTWIEDTDARIRALEENTLYNRFIRWSKYG